MAGTDEKVALSDDWSFANPSPRTLMSGYLSEEFASRPFSDFLAGKENEGIPSVLKMEKVDIVAKVEEVEASDDLPVEPSWPGAHKPNTHGGLAERIAANGFNVPKLNTALMGPANMASSSSNARSPYLTIPPGLSPTSLLESPVFLSNSMAQPSPTTGKLQFAHNGYTGLSSVHPAAYNKNDDTFEDVTETFAFKPSLESHSYSSSERKVIPEFGQVKTVPSATVSAQLEKPKEMGITEAGSMNFQNEEFSFQTDTKDSSTNTFNQRKCDSFMGSNHSMPNDTQQDGDIDLKEELSSVAVGTPAEDGYNWRKYGQKQVKGSEYPRSYYKCTHPNCQVKKKVERSQEGQITEITYKGTHNHPKPPPNRRSGILLSHPFNDPNMDPNMDGLEQHGLQVTSDSKAMWTSVNMENEGQGWQGDCPEASSSALVAAEYHDPCTNTQQIPHGSQFSSDAIDVSSTMSNDEDEDDRATHGSVSLGCDEGDETESKRIKSDTSTIEMSAASRAVREPRVVVQTTSEVDILDDGYRWRKYGQKVVKGNPNPRSYYKCTHPGCNVRKHVERAAHDLKSVITTYEGKHNHEVPAARNSGHVNSATSNSTTTVAPQPHGLLPRAQPAQAGLMRFEGHAPLSAAFGLPGAGHLRPMTNFTFGMGQPGLTNLAMSGLRPLTPMKMPVHPSVHPYLGHRPTIEGGFVIPKGEPNEEPMAESSLSMPKPGTMHPQMMNGVPIRPQL